ncbi:MAG: hypothetical protein Roseis2KO_40600 [Roseivirga sp.]
MIKKLTLFLLTLLFRGCIGDKTEVTFYKDVKTDEVIDHSTFMAKKLRMADQIPEIFKGAKVEAVIYDERTRNDSIIITYDLVINASDTPAKPSRVYQAKGKNLPDATLITIDNREISISDFEGKPTIINFWFIGCAPCIQEMPVLNRFKEEYGDQVNFLAITFDNQEKVEKFLKKQAFNFLLVVGAQDYISALGIHNYPTTLFIDAKGIVQHVKGGIPYDEKNGKMVIGDGASFEKLIVELLP